MPHPLSRFWEFIARYTAPFAAVVMLLALVLTVYSAQSTRSLGRCVDRWAAQYVAASTTRANAHDAVQTALDALIRAVPTADTPGAQANFENHLEIYIAASNAEASAEKRHPLPPAPTLNC